MRQLKITKSITNRETASLDKYLQDIGKEELITADEEVQLAQKVKQGDQQALENSYKKSFLPPRKCGFNITKTTTLSIKPCLVSLLDVEFP